MSGSSSVPGVSARASQSGFALAVEMLCHASPSTPETGALSRFSVILCTTPESCGLATRSRERRG